MNDPESVWFPWISRSIDFFWHPDQMVVNGFGEETWSNINLGGESCELLIHIRQLWENLEVWSTWVVTSELDPQNSLALRVLAYRVSTLGVLALGVSAYGVSTLKVLALGVSAYRVLTLRVSNHGVSTFRLQPSNFGPQTSVFDVDGLHLVSSSQHLTFNTRLLDVWTCNWSKKSQMCWNEEAELSKSLLWWFRDRIT